ncbi:MAG: mechanosensitive ion channel family protein [Deltaproteobacteria bacterium]|nr:mechanosensitive ion channel family protein [Deltaproteobacteria bacterium]
MQHVISKLASLLSLELYHMSLWSWTAALALTTLLFLLLRFAQSAFAKKFKKKTAASPYTAAQIAGSIVEGTSTLSIAALSLWIGMLTLKFPEPVHSIAREAVLLVLFVQSGLWASILVSFFWESYFKGPTAEDSAERRSLMHLVALITKITIWVLITLLILSNLGINVSALLTGLGIGGVAVAFALQRVLGDFLAYVSIVLDRTFEVGDFIVVGSFKGNVEKIGVRSTQVRSLSGERLIFPNADLLSSRIQNFKTLSERRVVFTLRIAHETPYQDLQRIPGILREIISAQPATRFDRSHFVTFGESAFLFETVYFVLNPDYNFYMEIQQAINLAICKRFEEAGIMIAYPTQTVYLNQSTQIQGDPADC